MALSASPDVSSRSPRSGGDLDTLSRRIPWIVTRSNGVLCPDLVVLTVDV